MWFIIVRELESYNLEALSQWKEAAKLMGAIWNLLLIGIIWWGGNTNRKYFHWRLFKHIALKQNWSQRKSPLSEDTIVSYTSTDSMKWLIEKFKSFLCCDVTNSPDCTLLSTLQSHFTILRIQILELESFFWNHNDSIKKFPQKILVIKHTSVKN